MDRFLQLHLLTSYPPANLNRDDLGRPKTAMMGGSQRLRVSSQSLKRAWRTSGQFKHALDGHLGKRTKLVGEKVYKALLDHGLEHERAYDWAFQIAGRLGKVTELSKAEGKELKDDPAKLRKRELESLETDQLVHVGPTEWTAIMELATTMASRGEGPSEDELALLSKRHGAVDIALFGRMVAAQPVHNVEAAAQVGHAVTVHEVQVEDDFFTAVDDLNEGIEDVGAGHMGETEFGAGLFYLYLCVDRQLLAKNLGGDNELADQAVAALVETAATVAPTGKQASFASRARASYMLAETGDQQPRNLAVAFLDPIPRGKLLDTAIKRLTETMECMDKVYGACATARASLNAATGEGSLADVIACARG